MAKMPGVAAPCSAVVDIHGVPRPTPPLMESRATGAPSPCWITEGPAGGTSGALGEGWGPRAQTTEWSTVFGQKGDRGVGTSPQRLMAPVRTSAPSTGDSPRMPARRNVTSGDTVASFNR